MERLVGKLRSMQLVVPGAIGHFYTMHIAANLSAQFHQHIKLYCNLCFYMTYRSTYLADLLHRPASDHGYTDTFGLGARGVWIDPNENSNNYTYRVKWPANITQELVSFTNPEGTITNSYLELEVMVLHNAVFSSIIAFPAW